MFMNLISDIYNITYIHVDLIYTRGDKTDYRIIDIYLTISILYNISMHRTTSFLCIDNKRIF